MSQGQKWPQNISDCSICNLDFKIFRGRTPGPHFRCRYCPATATSFLIFREVDLSLYAFSYLALLLLVDTRAIRHRGKQFPNHGLVYTFKILVIKHITQNPTNAVLYWIKLTLELGLAPSPSWLLLVFGQGFLIDGVLPSSRVDRLNEVAGANGVWREQARGINVNVCQKVMHLCSIDSLKNVLFLPWICSNFRRCARSLNRNSWGYWRRSIGHSLWTCKYTNVDKIMTISNLSVRNIAKSQTHTKVQLYNLRYRVPNFIIIAYIG